MVKKLLILLMTVFLLSPVLFAAPTTTELPQEPYSPNDYSKYIHIDTNTTNGGEVPVFLVSKGTDYDWNNDGKIDQNDSNYCYEHNYIYIPSDLVSSKEDINFDDGTNELQCDPVYFNQSKIIYAEYIVKTNQPDFYIRIRQLYPHQLNTYQSNYVFGSNDFPYWIDDNNNIWTKLSIPANGTKTIYIQKIDGYQPNGSNVFEFFDDFNGTTLLTQGTASVSYPESSIARFSGGGRYSYKYYPNLLISPNIIIEGKVRVPSGNPVAAIGGVAFTQINSSGYGYLLDERNDYGNTIRRDGSLNRILVTGSASLTKSNIWYTQMLVWKSDGTLIGKLYDSTGNNIETLTATDTTYSNGYIGINCHDNIDFDYIFVRKYTDKEPTATVEQISTDIWKITITNPNNYDLNDFQVKINGTGIVNSKTDSILLSDNLEPSIHLDDAENPFTPPVYTLINTTNGFSIDGPQSVLVKTPYIFNITGNGNIFDINFGDNNQITTTSKTDIQHIYDTTGDYYLIVSSDTNVHRYKKITVYYKTYNENVVFKYENGSLVKDKNITISTPVDTYNFDNKTSGTVQGLLNQPITATIGQTTRSIIPTEENDDLVFYFPNEKQQLVEEIIKSYNQNDKITIEKADKIIYEGYGKIDVALPIGGVYSVCCNGKYQKDITIGISPNTVVIQPTAEISSMTIWETSDAYHVLLKEPTLKEYIIKVLVDNNDVINQTVYSSSNGNTITIYKGNIVQYMNDTKITSHIITIEIRDENNNVIKSQAFYLIHYVKPAHTATMQWFSLLMFIIIFGVGLILAKEFSWAGFLMTAAVMVVLMQIPIFQNDYKFIYGFGTIMGLAILTFIINKLSNK